MIESFGDKETEDLFHGRKSRRILMFPPDIVSSALRKLDMLNAVRRLEDLRCPPGNRLEALKGNLKGFYSIRVNNQWRIIFHWDENIAQKVSLTDYHS